MPLESWDSSEVRVVRMQHCLVFNSKGSNVGIRHQVRAAADGVKDILQVCEMFRAGIKRLNVGILEPTLHSAQGG